MHSVVRLLAVMSIGALSQALATEPEQPASTAAQPSQASSSSQAAATPSDQQASAKPPTTPSTAAAPTSASTAANTATQSGKITPELVKKAQGMGYKLKHRGDDVYFCRKEATLGSRFEKEVCSTPEQLDLVARETQEMVQKAQRIGMPPAN